ncbi:MAG: hypothetical protein WB684_12360, partial [Gaiella sp.]
ALPLYLSPQIQRRRTGRPLCFGDDFRLGHKSFFIRMSPRPRSSDASCRCAPQAPPLITSIKIASFDMPQDGDRPLASGMLDPVCGGP